MSDDSLAEGQVKKECKMEVETRFEASVRPSLTALKDPGLSVEEVIGAQGHHPSQDRR